MFATVSTWRLDVAVQPTQPRDQLVRELLEGGIAIVRQAGVLDVLVIEIDPDLLVFVSVFETLEEAETASLGTWQLIADRYADKLELISRVTGCAYDPPQFVTVDRLEAQRWREDADAMYAELVTWRLDESIRSPEQLEVYLGQIWQRSLMLLKQLGLLDVLVVRIADDAILAIRLYADRIEADGSTTQARAAAQDILTGKVELIEKQTGRALDVPQLLNS